MIRNPKVLVVAAMALVASGALGISRVQAAEFHCSVEPCRVTLKPDGEVPSKTAHQVFILSSGASEFSLTCEKVSAEATSLTKTTSELTLTNISYTCSNFTMRMNGCAYRITASGTTTIICPEGKSIELVINNIFTECIYTIPSQGPLGNVTYHDVEPKKKEQITVESHLGEVKLILDGGQAKCGLNPEQEPKLQVTTGNTILTSETDPGGVMANLWWE
jgi:hypothetical protein